MSTENFLNSLVVNLVSHKSIKENNYGQMQYTIQQFCQKLKFNFTGNHYFEFGIEENCPVLKQIL